MTRVSIICVAAVALVGCSRQAERIPTSNSNSVNATAFNVANAPTVQFSAPDMMCPEGCGEKVKEILSEQPGAKEVIVDFDAKTATVATEGDGKFDANAAVAALVDHGFKNSSVKSDSATTANAKQQVSGSNSAP
jgi:copper chaperone CopZ